MLIFNLSLTTSIICSLITHLNYFVSQIHLSTGSGTHPNSTCLQMPVQTKYDLCQLHKSKTNKPFGLPNSIQTDDITLLDRIPSCCAFVCTLVMIRTTTTMPQTPGENMFVMQTKIKPNQ